MSIRQNNPKKLSRLLWNARTFSTMIFFACSIAINAQDIIVKKSGEIENVKVLEVSPTEIKYKMTDNPDGPLYIEKRSDIHSIKYQNGDIQLLNDKPAKIRKKPSSPSAYTEVKKFNHEFDLFIGNGWGAGYQLRKEFNPYVGWDIIGVSYMTAFDNPKEIGLVNLRPLGIKGFTPAYKAIRGYAGLNLGYSFAYERDYFYRTYNKETWEYTDKHTFYYKYHFFGLDFSLGVQIHRNIAIGYNLNFITNSDGGVTNHMAKLSFIF